LPPDKVRLQDFDEALCKFLAWESILAERLILNLDPHQVKQAEAQLKTADSTVNTRLPELYQWLLVPVQVNPQAAITWQAIRLMGSDPLAMRASKKLRTEELLITILGSTILRKHLDDVPLWRGGNVAVKQLIEDFARYPYLRRLTGPEVLIQAIRDGVGLLTWRTDTFAFAEIYDEKSDRYLGLRGGQNISISSDSSGLIVKSDIARIQIELETQSPTSSSVANTGSDIGVPSRPGTKPSDDRPKPKRFHGTVHLNPERVGRDASRIADEVIANLAGQMGAEVKVTLEIEALLPDGASEQTVRTVTENARTLKFDSHGFEKE